ncbi:MAG: DUF389 domain-containing protein [Oscillospiraceae bacterium]|nr:DUF389 domain-containing protein [Oscillospiraceae bacterium]
MNENKPAKPHHSRIWNFFHSLFDMREDTMDHAELHEMMYENTVIHGSNMWILMLAILIASIGLNVNSTAVIIGAMLISPLMSGILTMGYSLAVKDLAMLRRALTRFAAQVVISLITSTLYFFISPLDIPTSEMIARTSPTIWDVLIALFGGVAGTIGNTRQKKSNVIPGVAIATALMPPLCTAGYGLATMQPRFIFGAFYLFLINTLFIMLSAALVIRILKIPANEIADKRKEKRITVGVTIITIITVIPSILIGAVTVYSGVMERNISNYISNEFVFSDTQVVQSSADNVDRVISVSLVGATVSDDVIDVLEKAMERYGLKDYTLRVTQNRMVVDGENNDKITIAVQEKTIQDLNEQLDAQKAQIDEQGKRLGEFEREKAGEVDYLRLSENASKVFTKLSDCYCGAMSGGAGDCVILTAHVEEPLSEEEIAMIKNWLILESGAGRAELVVFLPEENTQTVEE